LIGFYTGLGRSSAAIARTLDDGTSSHSIRRNWKRWGLPRAAGAVVVPVALNVYLRARLISLAESKRLSPEEWLRRVVAAAIKDDLFEAVAGDENE
jgi:hypothetical protein